MISFSMILFFFLNKMLDVKGYSFYLNTTNKFEWDPTHDIFIHDSACYIIYHESFNIDNDNLDNKLKVLKDFVDGLLNNQKLMY